MNNISLKSLKHCGFSHNGKERHPGRLRETIVTYTFFNVAHLSWNGWYIAKSIVALFL